MWSRKPAVPVVFSMSVTGLAANDQGLLRPIVYMNGETMVVQARRSLAVKQVAAKQLPASLMASAGRKRLRFC